MITISSRIAVALFLFRACLGASGALPLFFEPNRGQAPPQVRFLAPRGDHTIFLTDRELVLKSRDASSVTVRLVGARKPRVIQGQQLTGGISNYIFGSDPSKWRTDIPNFARVQYYEVYPGIDLVFHSREDRLEYDFVVAPGADTKKIQLEIEGTSGITLDDDGNLLLHTKSGLLKQEKPAVYREASGGRVRVAAGFVLSDAKHVAIQVSDYDRGQPLIIDPVISFSATLGTSTGPATVALDPAGNLYVINGSTPLAPLGTISVTKLDPTLSTILYSTHFGPADTGSGVANSATGIAVDSSGDAYVTGYTSSPSFPTTPGAYQTTLGDSAQSNVFLMKLGPTGGIGYSTYLGGNAEDQGNCVAVDAAGSAYVAGSTQSTNFPTTPGAYQQPEAGSFAAFVTKFKPDGSGLLYSTIVRTGVLGTTISAIALDSNGNAYLGGVGTASVSILTNPPDDGLVAKLNPTGTNLLYSKFIGGTGNDFINGIAVDSLGNAYVAGTTASNDFPTTPGALQTNYGGGLSDAFAAKLSPDGATVLYATYLGGSGNETASAIAINSTGEATIVGSTTSVDFPVSNALQSINSSLYLGNFGTTAYVTKLGGTGSNMIFSTYLGGHIGEGAAGIALDQSGNAYVTGSTSSPDFPVTPGTIQTAVGPSGADAFLTKINDPTTCIFSTSVIQPSDAGGSIFVSAPPGCFWYATKTDSWVTFGATTSGEGNGTVTYTMITNPGAARSAYVSVAGQRLALSQADNCGYSVPTALTLSLGEDSFYVITGPGCMWNIASNVDWLTVSVSGVPPALQLVTVVGTPNMTLQPMVGTITFTGLTPITTVVTINVTQPVAATTMSVQPYALNFGMSGSIMTGPQTITVTFSGPAQPAWTASADQPNIQISPTSGIGSATIQVSVSPGLGQYVTVSAPGVSSGIGIPVRIFNVANGAPFGSFDTPEDNTTGVAGAIPVTGWALDNVQVSKVDVWREPVASEPPGGLVYIGDGTFVEGTRPDLPPRYPNTPFNSRAGWGYMLLSNFLPNNNGGSGGLGNGTYRLHAIAHNLSGAATDLGTRTITVDNAHASKPFGTIDTPAQGGTMSGNAYVNFGWAVTQNPYVIPLDGSTINVILDGVAIGHPTYNQFRNDIATLFPGLANSNGPVGFYYIDTTTLTNGLHTIAWTIADNQGRSDGIGSRYINVLNSGGTAVPEQTAFDAQPSGAIVRRDLNGAATQLEPDDDGVLRVKMQELERVELDLGANSGHLLTNAQGRSLPIGSTLKNGIFYWQTGLGFLGDYDLVFTRTALSDLHVRISIGPKRFGPEPTQSASPDR
jgi:hypothetical protein